MTRQRPRTTLVLLLIAGLLLTVGLITYVKTTGKAFF